LLPSPNLRQSESSMQTGNGVGDTLWFWESMLACDASDPMHKSTTKKATAAWLQPCDAKLCRETILSVRKGSLDWRG
jgi:hypothetical protein